MRSYAWANPADPFGERVISGLAEGVTLRLDGTGYTRVLALGSAVRILDGAARLAAFAGLDVRMWDPSTQLRVVKKGERTPKYPTAA